MATFLVGIPYVDYAMYVCEKDGLPLPDGSTDFTPYIVNIYIKADSEEQALEWASHIGERFSRETQEVPDWKERNIQPYIERNPDESWLRDVASFLQTVRVGEEPRYEGMTPEAYVEWLEGGWR